MLRVLLANILNPKVVDNKGEVDGAGVMFPETRGCLALAISMLSKAFFKKLLGNDTSLWQAVHPLLYLVVYVAVGGGFVAEIIMLNDVVWHVGNAKAHVFVSGNWGIKIEFLDVHCHEFCSGG